jgi:hypothetical protein
MLLLYRRIAKCCNFTVEIFFTFTVEIFFTVQNDLPFRVNVRPFEFSMCAFEGNSRRKKIKRGMYFVRMHFHRMLSENRIASILR